MSHDIEKRVETQHEEQDDGYQEKVFYTVRLNSKHTIRSVRRMTYHDYTEGLVITNGKLEAFVSCEQALVLAAAQRNSREAPSGQIAFTLETTDGSLAVEASGYRGEILLSYQEPSSHEPFLLIEYPGIELSSLLKSMAEARLQLSLLDGVDEIGRGAG